MRIPLLLALIIFTGTIKAQTAFPVGFSPVNYRGAFDYNANAADSNSHKKWFLTRYSALSASYSVFKGGHATVFSVPVGLQLNRRLTNNLYAFANATIAPAYVTLNRSFTKADFNKGLPHNGVFKSSGLDMYTSASLGLQYINDARTFSISGSISVERGNYPLLPYYRTNDDHRPAPSGGSNRQ
jgi:hypothetical protein